MEWLRVYYNYGSGFIQSGGKRGVKGGCNRVEGETTGREVMVGFMETGK